MEAILLVGHGSRLTEANESLREMAQMVREIGDIPIVEIAYLQFSRPDFLDGVSACVSRGAKRIIIHPYFLYKGRHFDEDITELVTMAQRRFEGIEFVLTEPLGIHENIARLVLERARNNLKPVRILKPDEIEERSFEIISDELGRVQPEVDFRDIELPIVKRVIHATGDFDFIKNMRFHPEAVEAGIRAIKNGKDVLVDVKMVEAGVNKKTLERWGGKVICKIQSKEQGARNKGDKTMTELGIESAVKENPNIGIVAIGNAPTALYRTMKLIRNEGFKPELVIGVPVGFVRAVESKEVLLHMKYPFITSLGRKGGSTVAVAIVNALLRMADS